MPGPIGWTEVVILLVLALLIFGPKRLPEMGRSLGRGMREFKDSVTGKDRDEPEAPLAELPPVDEEEPVVAPSSKRKTRSS